ncbi:hypothetical protein [Ruegeria sp. Alg231-54]|uniref:hypothetical protein n=1 Tax=Ruegeria sp. Alg231-54 TaxID=1922221 RepID=UPI0018FFF026|nr:hypothetical protein [Ruegeria sp. Alg231-54]
MGQKSVWAAKIENEIYGLRHCLNSDTTICEMNSEPPDESVTRPVYRREGWRALAVGRDVRNQEFLCQFSVSPVKINETAEEVRETHAQPDDP